MSKRAYHRVSSYKEFNYREQNNIKRLGINGIMKSADYLVYNNGGMRDLEKNIGLLLDRLGAR